MVSEVELAENSSSNSKVFLGEVSANKHKPWTADNIVRQDCVTFKLDFGILGFCHGRPQWPISGKDSLSEASSGGES